MTKPTYDHGVLRNAKGEVVAEKSFDPPASIWQALAQTEKSRKR